MTDDPKGGTLEQGEGNADEATRTPAPDGADAGAVESAEDRAKRLESELANTKKLIAGLQSKAERLNELERSGALAGPASTSPMPMPAADPDQAMLAQLVEEYRQYPTAAGAYAIRDAQARMQARQEQAWWESHYSTNARGIDVSDTDDDTKALAKELLKSRRFADADAALLAARGQRGDKKAAAEAERARRDEAARQRVAASPGTAMPGDTAPATNTKKMTGKAYLAELDRLGESDAARRLVADMDTGRVVVDWTQT